MRIVADLHVHGRFSVATSRSLSLATLYQAALRKGIDLVGTGDVVHPGWRREARESLQEEDGLFRLQPSLISSLPPSVVPGREIRFMLTAEISTIYSDRGRVRKVHHLVCLPSFDAADRLSSSLARVGSVESDGRPILGLRSRDLLEMVLSCDPRAVLVPAHIWTPWFSVLGSRGGYDRIEECYGDLSPHLTAVETGLSSDPAMNWRLSALDRFSIVSNSDAHSAEKVGREATVFRCAASFDGVVGAMRPEAAGIEGTIEFFPEEGKYHLDGHRACGVRLEPEETRRLNGMCPSCGGAVTVGVMHRVSELADRPVGFRPPTRPPFLRLVPLTEVLGQALGIGPSSRAVEQAYAHVIRTLGPELHVLTEVAIPELERVAGDRVAEAVANMREGRVATEPGYDGQYGVIHLLRPPPPRERLAGVDDAQLELSLGVAPSCDRDERQDLVRLSSNQCLAVIAGPGSGKTQLLTERMASTLQTTTHPVRGITFTRAAARELAERLRPITSSAPLLWTGTLHQLAYDMLRAEGHEINLYDDRQRAAVLRWRLAREGHPVTPARALRLVQRVCALRHGAPKTPAPSFGDGMLRDVYARAMQEAGAQDFDDLIGRAVEIASRAGGPEPAHVFVDEFQDLDRAQYEMVRRLSAPAPSLMVIGDPFQSIYGFRGGDAALLARVRDDFPLCREVYLTTCYRCGERILRAADAVVRREPCMTAATGEQGAVELLRAGSSQGEARMVAGKIKEVLGGITMERAHCRAIDVRGFKDIAVLVRTGSMVGVFARALQEAGIPCRTARATALSEDPWVAGVLAWLRLGLNPESIADLLMVRRWSGKTESVPHLSAQEAREARTLIEGSPHDAVTRVLARRDAGEADPVRREALERLARESSDLRDFVLKAMAEREAGTLDPRAEAVRVMTIHAAKGLEFGAVFVTGFRDGIMPLRDADMDEERRLCYVAMTRARSYVGLTYSGEQQRVSRFARDIPADVLTPARRVRPRSVQLELELA